MQANVLIPRLENVVMERGGSAFTMLKDHQRSYRFKYWYGSMEDLVRKPSNTAQSGALDLVIGWQR